MATRYDCHACKKQVTATKSDRYRSHSDGDGEPCPNSSAEIPKHILAQPVGRDLAQILEAHPHDPGHRLHEGANGDGLGRPRVVHRPQGRPV